MSLQVATPPRAAVVRRVSNPVHDLVGAFESETAAVLLRTSPLNEHLIVYGIAVMTVVALILMSVVKLDKVVNSTGSIVTAAGSIYVSPFDTGIVREVKVKTGEVVKKGQTLAVLDPTFTHADLSQLQQRYDSDEAAVARGVAELAGRPYVYSRTDPYQSTQGGIWQKRQSEYQSNLANYDGQIRGIEAQIAQFKADADQYGKRLKLAGELENVYKPLLDKGYVSKLQLMQATDSSTEMTRLLADAGNQSVQAQHTLASVKAQREAFIQKWQSDTGAQLVADRNDLDITRQNLAKAQKLSDLTTLDAPADAVVLRIGKVSTGSVASGGGSLNTNQDPLFTLVPLDAPVEADVNIRAADIGFIKTGDPVHLKLDAYRFMQHGTAKGVVTSVSEGSFTTDENGLSVEPYFKVRVAIKEAKLRNVPKDFRLVPGMTLIGDIMVGSRTILSYLVEGGLRTGAEAMREP